MLRWPGFTALLLATLAAVPAALAQAPAAGELVVNEINYDPPQTPEGNFEWVEVFNRSGRTLDLNDVQVGDSGALVEITGTAAPLAAGEYAVLVRDAATFNATFPGTPGLVLQVAGFPTLNNTGDTVRLVASAGGAAIDAVVYTPSFGGTGASLERRDPAGPSTSAANFGTTTDPAGGTPGRVNSLFASDTVGPMLVSATASLDGRTVTVTVDEPLDPASVTAGAFSVGGPAVTGATYDGATTVVLTLSGPLPAGASTVTASGLRDLAGNTTAASQTTVTFSPDVTPPALVGVAPGDATTLTVTFSEPLDPASVQPADFQIDGGIGAPAGATASGATVTLTLAVPLQNATGYTLTVTDVADAAGNALASAQASFFFGSVPPAAVGDVVINEILYDPPAPQPSSSEWIEVFNRSAEAVDLGGLTITDGTGTSAAVPAPFVLQAGAYAVFVANGPAFQAAYPGVPFTALASFPTLNNTGDRPALRLDGVELDAVPYLAAWGGTDASLERRDPNGPSTSASNFGTSTSPQGGTPGAQNTLFSPDVTGPMLVSAAASLDGRSVTVTVDEPLDPASVTAGAFSTSGSAVIGAAYDGATTVTLTLAGPLPAGASTVTASGLVDLLGNVTPQSQTTVTFAPDTTPPTIASAAPLTATTVRVVFSEPVTAASASNPSAYALDGGIGSPTAVDVETGPGGGATAATLTLATPLADQQTYTLTATGLTDLAGNTTPTATATLFFGTVAPPDVRDVVINEVMYDPPAPQPATNEWIEVVNRSGRAVDLGGLTVTDGSGTSAAVPAPFVLQPGAYAVFVANAAAFQAAYPGVPFTELSGFPTLNNSGDRPAIVVGGTEIDAVPYLASWGGTDASLERRDPNGPSTSSRNFTTSTAPLRATPGAINSQFAPDVTGPLLVSAMASPDGRTVVVALDEPADPASVTAGAFAVSGRTVTAATYDADAATVTLTLDQPLTAGAATVTATGLVDLLGNATPTTQTTVTFTPDATPPTLARAFAQSPTTVRVVFSEPVTAASAGDPAAYTVDGLGAPTAVVAEAGGGGVAAVTLTFADPGLVERQVYTLSVTGLTDLAGNTNPSASATLFFGTADTPARGELVINEILYDPAGGSDGEFVELLNTTADRVFDLGALTLDGDLASRDPAPVLPGQFAVVTRNAAAFAAAFPGVAFVVDTGLSLSNSGDTVVLRAGDAVIDSVAYDPDWHREELDDATGISLERRDPAGPSSAASNWSSSLDPTGATPGRANTQTVADNPQPRDGGVTVTSPFAPDEGQAGRIAYTLEAPAALVRVRIYDGGGRLVREVEDGRLSGASGEVLWDGRGMNGERLRAGIYIVLLEAVDVEGGTSEAHRAAIVLARR